MVLIKNSHVHTSFLVNLRQQVLTWDLGICSGLKAPQVVLISIQETGGHEALCLSVKPPTPRQARVQVKENLKLTFKEGTTMSVSQSVAG